MTVEPYDDNDYMWNFDYENKSYPKKFEQTPKVKTERHRILRGRVGVKDGLFDLVLSKQSRDIIRRNNFMPDQFEHWIESEKGTKNYCSSDIFLANFYSKASDVYAFAMTVYAIMTTETPFKGLKPDEIKSKVINNGRPQIPESSMNPAYESLIQQCWSQNPEERPSCNEIVGELENNEGFITETVDENEYFDYVDYLKEYSTTFDPSKRIELTRLFLQKSNKNIEEAERITEESNDIQKDQHQLSEFSNNRIEEKSEVQSAKDLKIAADKGDIDAMNNYGEMLYASEDAEMNKEETGRYFQMAADKGQIDAMNKYGFMLSNGEGVEMNQKEACRYIKMAADKSHIKAMYNYGLMLYNGEGVEMNKGEVCRYFKMAADEGQIDAMNNYGEMLYRGEGVEINKEEACRYYKMAADNSHIGAMKIYGLLLETGQGIPMNKKQASRYLKMAENLSKQ